MLTILKNSRLRVIISLGASFSIGQLMFGALRDTIGPIGVLLAVLAAMPFLAWGFYQNLTVISAHLESAQEAD